MGQSPRMDHGKHLSTYKCIPLAGIKRKSSCEQDNDWTKPPAKQMVIENTSLSFSDSHITNDNGENILAKDEMKEKEDAGSENTYYEFEENCTDLEESLAETHGMDDSNNNNNDMGSANNNTTKGNRGQKRSHDKIRSMVLSDEVLETISKRPNDGKLLPQSIMDQMCKNTSKALVLWQASPEQLSVSSSTLVKTPETIGTVDEDEEDETNIIIKSLEEKVAIHDGDMEL